MCVCVCVCVCVKFCEMFYYLKENMVYQSPKLHVWKLIGLGGTKIHYWHYSQRNCTTVQHIKPVNDDSKNWTNHLIREGLMDWRYQGMFSLTCKWLGCYLNFRIWFAKRYYWTWKFKNYELNGSCGKYNRHYAACLKNAVNILSAVIYVYIYMYIYICIYIYVCIYKMNF